MTSLNHDDIIKLVQDSGLSLELKIQYKLAKQGKKMEFCNRYGVFNSFMIGTSVMKELKQCIICMDLAANERELKHPSFFIKVLFWMKNVKGGSYYLQYFYI